MEFQIIKKKKVNDNFYSKKLRVAAYVRVSTKLELQLYSYESQIKYYKNLISKNSNWKLVDLYSDYGISGTSRTKRTEFLRMVEDAYDGKIDFIITKSVSRFARNTVDALEIIRELRRRNIGIFFEEEHLNTLKLESELLLTILCSVAQQESLNTSEHVHLGNIMRMKQGKVVTSHKIYGYDVVKLEKTSTFKIIEKEAKIVREMFGMYIKGYSFNEIANNLNERKIKKTYKNKKWNRFSIEKIIKNQAYVGDLVQGKKYVIEVDGEKRYRINKGERDLYIVENHHPAIISREDWEKAKKVNESKKIEREKNNDALSIPVICGFCGGAMGCANRKTYNWQYICFRKKCQIEIRCNDSVTINYDLIKKSFLTCIKKLSRNMYRQKIISNPNELSKTLSKLKKKKDLLLQRNIDNINKYMNKDINLYEFKQKEKNNAEQLLLIENNIQETEEKITNYKDSKTEIENLFFIIDNELNSFEEFDIELLRRTVKFVIIGGQSEKGTKLPYMIRFIYSNKTNLRNVYKEKVLNNKLSNTNYIKLLDFKTDYKIRFVDSKGVTKYRKGNRVLFEIER